MRWKYESTNLPGNFHSAALWISNNHPEWDVIAMDFNGGHYTVVVYRIPKEEK